MRTHLTSLLPRAIRAALRVHTCRYRVVAVGVDYRSRVIGLATNMPRLERRGWHAEERLIHRSPRSLRTVLIARVGADGELLPIDPCEHCRKLADKYGVRISRLA